LKKGTGLLVSYPPPALFNQNSLIYAYSKLSLTVTQMVSSLNLGGAFLYKRFTGVLSFKNFFSLPGRDDSKG